jgi:hypothetical protein
MSLNNFLKQVDPVIHKQYTMEKFKSGHTGRNFVAEEPEFKFEAPKFKKKLKLPKASEDPRPAGYLTARKLNPEDFYYAEHFKKFANSLKPTFDSEDYDEERIIIPLYYEKNLIGFQGRSLGLTACSFATRLQCAVLTLMLVSGGLAILCGFMITNPATKKLQTEYLRPSILVSR